MKVGVVMRPEILSSLEVKKEWRLGVSIYTCMHIYFTYTTSTYAQALLLNCDVEVGLVYYV